MFVRSTLLAGLTVAAVSCAACAKPAAKPRGSESLRVDVKRVLPHDPQAFTQGMEWFEGRIYESTGLVGRSSIRRVDLESGTVELSVPVEQVFAEGLTRVGGRLYQLTWRDGRALVWNLGTLTKEREFPFEGEGWGLCFDGKRLVMSDGSAHLTFRDPETFAVTGTVTVKRDGAALPNLNELECVDGAVYANIWQDMHIARIDPSSGEVTGWIDASGLLTGSDAIGTDVLNGVAWLPDKRRFLITGKLWPKAFEVEFVPVVGAK